MAKNSDWKRNNGKKGNEESELLQREKTGLKDEQEMEGIDLDEGISRNKQYKLGVCQKNKRRKDPGSDFS